MPWIYVGDWRFSSISALVGGEWSGSRLCLFIPREAGPGPYCIGHWVGPIVGLDMWRRENLLPMPEIKLQFLGCPACSLVTILTGLSWPSIKLKMGKNICDDKEVLCFILKCMKRLEEIDFRWSNFFTIYPKYLILHCI
jgi:hypothetical protein